MVWATIDKSAGRGGIKSFVVEKGAPGFKLDHLEKKLGIRASDTGAFVLNNCRIPKDNILGSSEVKKEKTTAGFKGVMKTFDNTRPHVAAQGLGIARAAVEFTREKLEEAGAELDYSKSPNNIKSSEKDYYLMEANLEAARLLTWRAAWMADNGERNSMEASMSKAKTGRAATLITQKCCELLGPVGYSCSDLAEKWMRDAKIIDIYEGTGQIQHLIVARQFLDAIHDGNEGIGVIVVVGPLEDARQPFQPHAGVDRRFRQVDALFWRDLLVLHEDQPALHLFGRLPRQDLLSPVDSMMAIGDLYREMAECLTGAAVPRIENARREIPGARFERLELAAHHFGDGTAHASVHLVEISEDARTHYHKRLTEIYVVLEGEGFMELDGERARKPLLWRPPKCSQGSTRIVSVRCWTRLKSPGPCSQDRPRRRSARRSSRPVARLIRRPYGSS